MLRLLFSGAFTGGVSVTVSDGDINEFARQQYEDLIYHRQQPRVGVLYGLFGGTFAVEADVTRFITLFTALIDSPTRLTPGELDYLDYYGDGTLGYDDRDYWLNRVINENFSVVSRLSWANAAPTTRSESDPLGLIAGQANVIIMDSLNTSAVYIEHTSNNPCYTNAARTGSSTTLFDGSGQYRTTNMIWGDARCLVGDSGNSSRWRFPKDGAEVVVYMRGGSYTLERELTFIKEDGSATANTSITIRNYPGEVVNFYTGSQFIDPSYDNAVMMTVSRPDFHIDDDITIYGYRLDDSGNRIFSPGVLSVTNAADRFRFTATLRDFRAIAGSNGGTAHPDAATLTQYVDYAFHLRTGLSAGESTGKMLITNGIEIGLNNVGSKIENATIHPAGDDIPPSVTVPGGSTGKSYGESLEISGATDLTVRRCTFSGTSSHSAIRAILSTGVTPSGLIIEYNSIRNPENTGILLANADDSFIRYNRIYDFASRSDLSGNDGYGIQQNDGSGNEITDNAIWLGDDQGSESNWGIAIQVSQSDASTSWTDNLVKRNLLYRCGMFIGYSSGTLTTNIGRITDNTISSNVVFEVSDYNNTQTADDGLIVLNIGPNVTGHTDLLYPNGNVISNNLLYRSDGDTTVLVEKYYNTSTGTHSQNLDYTIAHSSAWFTGNISVLPVFTDPDEGDFTLNPFSSEWFLLGEQVPLTSGRLAIAPIFNANTDMPNVNRRVQSEVTTYSRT